MENGIREVRMLKVCFEVEEIRVGLLETVTFQQ